MPEHVEVGTARLLSLVSWIGEHPGVTVEDAAAHFGRTPHQLRRDVETLGDVGDSLPGSSFEVDWDLLEREGRLRVHTTMGLDLPPRLTRAEVTAVLVGLRAIAPVLDDDLRARLPRAAMSVAALATDTGDLSGGLAVSSAGEPDVRLAHLRRALSEGLVVTFSYTSPDGHVTERAVDPWELRRSGPGWVLRGWCHTAGGRRTFRVERMDHLLVTERPVGRRDQDPDTAPTQRVRLTLAPGARWVLDEVSCELVAHDTDSFTIEVPVWSRDWVEALLIDVSAHLLAVEPPSWATGMRDLARAALRVWTHPGVTRGAAAGTNGTGETR
ncbi:MAG: helix-turn-helix transcriptional regulator [Pauljensenia sp.]